jgi:microcin C transport system substrate-binding protein
VRVRKAMAHLLDRWKMNETLMYNQYKMHRAFYEDLYDADHPCPREPVPFDKEAARRLLAEAGWVANPQTGLLEKNGQPFRFRFLERSASFQKFLDIYTQDLRDVGIEMIVDQKDWSAWVKDMDEYNFDMTSCAWGGSVRKDPEPMWHTKSGKEPSGNNYSGLSNPEVDALIEEMKPIFDVATRHALVRRVEQIIAEEQPYALSWYADYTRLLYWNKFGTPSTVLSKYGSEGSAYWLWWYDEDSAADLEDAMDSGDPLPAKEYEVRFEERFKTGAH